MDFKKFILDIFFPINCLGCNHDDIWLCEDCENKIKINKNLTESVKFSPSYIDGFFVSANWEDKILQDVIHKFKYNFVQELSEPLSRLMIKKIHKLNTELIYELKDYVVLPVPLHRRRLAWRGFNQSELLSQAIAKEFGLQVNNNLLVRKKYTPHQVKLKSKKRQTNVLNAFEINCRNASQRVPANILLIDDVITTGVTMNEIAKVLKDNGVKKILGIAIARG